jgi:hypothetical protein
MKENKKNYMTPMVEFMNARVEKGFAGSGDTITGTGTEPFTEGGNTDISTWDFD